MPDLRAIALNGASKIFKKREDEDEIVDFSSSSGGISLDDTPQGKIVYVSVGRGWRKGRILSFDGETYKVHTKRGVVEVGEDRILTQEEKNALSRSPQNTRIRR